MPEETSSKSPSMLGSRYCDMVLSFDAASKSLSQCWFGGKNSASEWVGTPFTAQSMLLTLLPTSNLLGLAKAPTKSTGSCVCEAGTLAVTATERKRVRSIAHIGAL